MTGRVRRAAGQAQIDCPVERGHGEGIGATDVGRREGIGAARDRSA